MDDRSQPRAARRRLSHVDRGGRPRMVDVSGKAPTARRAIAEGEVACSQETLTLVIDGGGPKGDVLTVAELAGVMAAKRTAELIPLCHPLPLTDVVVRITPDRAASAFRVRAEAATTGPTGVEMEALTAVSVAALTIYDMVKGVERGVVIRSIHLLAKSGGASGDWQREREPVETVAPRAPRSRPVGGPGRAGGIRRAPKRQGG